MDTLLNVNTPRGDNEANHAGLTSNVSPKVQCPEAENSNTGVSSNFVPDEKYRWFVLRATYGRTKAACKELHKKNVRTFIPTDYVVNNKDGKKTLIKKPLLPNIIFAYMTRKQTHDFVKAPAPTASFLKYYTDKTKPIERTTGLNPPVTLPDDEMENFIKATSVESEHSMMLPIERCRFKKDEKVVVTKGEFKGVIGRVVRAAGQQRVGIVISGLGIYVTAYIPSDYMEPIKIDY